MKRTYEVLSIVCILLIFMSKSDAGPLYFGFIEEPVHSAVMGVGCSGTSLGKGGFNFYNPAGLSIAEKSFVLFDFTRIADDLGRVYFESGWVFPTWFIGGSFQSQQDQFQRADEKGIKPDAFSNQRGTYASALIGIKRSFYAMGITLNGVHEVIGDYSAYGLSGSAGVMFTIIPEHIYAGISAINAAGRHMRFMDKKEKLKSELFPAAVRGGVSWKDTLMQRFPITLSADVVYNWNDQLLTVPVGIDFNLLPPLAIRVGKRFNYSSELFSMGVGLQWKNIKFDAAFVPMVYVTDITIKRSFGLTYSLSTPKKVLNSKAATEQKQPKNNEPVIVPVEFNSDSGAADPKDTVKILNIIDSNKTETVPNKDTVFVSDTAYEPLIGDSIVSDSMSTYDLIQENSEKGIDSLKSSVSDSLLNADTDINLRIRRHQIRSR